MCQRKIFHLEGGKNPAQATVREEPGRVSESSATRQFGIGIDRTVFLR